MTHFELGYPIDVYMIIARSTAGAWRPAGRSSGRYSQPAQRTLAHLQQAEATFDPLPFDADAARAFGRVAASLRRSGRKATERAYDAMIAAIAIANGLPLHTCNPDDFTGIDDLIVVAVPRPDRGP